jgi:hypothetical protein
MYYVEDPTNCIAETAGCHGRISEVRTGVGMVARRIRYRAIYVQKINPVVDSIDRT